MKSALLTLVLVLGLLAGVFGPAQSVEAASYNTAFISSIVYMNVEPTDNVAAQVSFYFYPDNGGAAIPYPASGTLSVARNAAGSLYAGDVVKNDKFRGSVTMSSTKRMAVTAVQTPPSGGPVKVRMLSNGFSIGSPTMTVQSVRRTAAQVSVFSVMNADTEAGNVTVRFYNPGENTPVATDVINNLQAGYSKYYDMGTNFSVSSGTIPATFDGSVVVSSVKTANTGTAGAVVASSTEYDLGATTFKAYAFNAVTSGASTVYMPSAFCNYNQGNPGKGPINSFYALANSSDAAINIAVSYSDLSGNELYTQTFQNVAPGSKAVSNGCAENLPSARASYSGSATVTATWAGTPGTGSPTIVAVGKVTGYGYSTAFEGVASPGPAVVAVPYVRYANGPSWANGSRQRVFLAIQNVGDVTWDAQHKVTVNFYNDKGELMGTIDSGDQVIAKGQKFNVNASSINANFGYWSSSVGGGAVITAPSGGQLAVLARAQTFDASNGYLWSEDFLGIPLQ